MRYASAESYKARRPRLVQLRKAAGLGAMKKGKPSKHRNKTTFHKGASRKAIARSMKMYWRSADGRQRRKSGKGRGLSIPLTKHVMLRKLRLRAERKADRKAGKVMKKFVKKIGKKVGKKTAKKTFKKAAKKAAAKKRK